MFYFKVCFLLTFCLFAVSRVDGQGCPSVDIYFYDQVSVDSFPVKYPECQMIEGNVLIASGTLIRNLDSLYIIQSIQGSLVIRNNYKLGNIQGLSNLGWIGDNLLVINNDSLLHLNGLENIKSIDSLVIERNPIMENLMGMNGLKVAHHVELRDLPDIIGLDSLHRITGDYTIYNSQMQSYKAAPLLDTVYGEVLISRTEFLESLSGFEALRYAGDLRVVNTGIYDFSGMTGLVEIGQHVRISGNDSLQWIQGMTSLNRIGGNIEIIANEKLKGMPDLNGIRVITGNLILNGNDSLLNIGDLEHLEFVQGDLILEYNGLLNCNGPQSLHHIGGNLEISYNYSLKDISGFALIDSIGGQLSFYKNDHLESITGFDNLESVGGIRFDEMIRLTSIVDFVNLKEIRGNYEFSSIWRIPHLPFMPGIKAIEGNLEISNTPDLIDLVGLDSLKRIEGSLNLISGSYTLHGLEQLESCGNGLTFQYLHLNNLDPLSNLISIQGPLSLREMYNLNDIQGLRNIDPTTIFNTNGDHLNITENPFLVYCALENFCQVLQLGSSLSTISDNANGCDSYDQVISNCMLNSNDFEKIQGLRVFPNPTNGKLKVEMGTDVLFPFIETSVFNSTGQLVLHIKFHSDLSLEGLPPGLYTLVCYDRNHQFYTFRIVLKDSY